jgi:pyruvate/2-oxoglutarate dehydrogenase complex dihydrolipoamide acyltransferase (E2) component
MIEVKMPQFGMGIQEVQILRWLKSEGDRVTEDEPLIEIETAKAVTEVPAPESGVLTKRLAVEGETVPVYAVVAEIEGS